MTRELEIRRAQADSKSAWARPRAALGALALLLWLLALASPATAAPIHPPLPALDLTGGPSDPGATHPAQPFNHACGTAVDSEGDVYVASAGNDAIDVFNSAHEYLTSIPNTEEPCGLAVDTIGRLYVSDTTSGNVVRYLPDAYPLTGSPVYGTPTTVDASGNAKGIAVDPTDDRLYVAEGNRIDTYDSKGNLGIDEVQKVRILFTTTAGTFTLTFAGQTTSPIPYNASAGEVEVALENLGNIAPGDVSVTPSTEASNHLYLVTFEGAYAATDVPQLEVDPSGLLPNEVQKVTVNATAGKFKLEFEGEKTSEINYNASAGEVEVALENLGNIAPGDVSVAGGPGGEHPYLVTIKGAYAGSYVAPMPCDTSALTGTCAVEVTTFPGEALAQTITQGWSGHIGEGDLTDATGVAAYTYGTTHYISVADNAADEVKILSGDDIRALALRQTIDGSETPDGDIGFGSAGAYLAADQRNGHLLVYDDAHSVVDEFEARGAYVTQIDSPAFADAGPTAIAVDRSGGSNEGNLYVTTGAAAGAKLLAFGPLTDPSRTTRPDLSFELPNAKGVAVDSRGDFYVAAGFSVGVYDPTGTLLTTISGTNHPSDVEVDSAGNVYVLDTGFFSGDEEVVRYAPQAFPPVAGTDYSAPATIATPSTFGSTQTLEAIGLNPANGHLFVTQAAKTMEFDSAANGSGIVTPSFAAGFNLDRRDIAAYGPSGDIYIAGNGVNILSADGTRILTRIDGSGSPLGSFSGPLASIAVDQANGHAIVFTARGVAEEYESSGAFVTQFGSFPALTNGSGIAVDRSGSQNDGTVYVAFHDDLSAFGPLNYGEPPIATTGLASGIGAGNATLDGTIDPRGFPLSDCHFDYETDAQYVADGNSFASATPVPCAETPAQIGAGATPVPVHADLTGLDPTGRYRLRLVASNEFGTDNGDPALFGPPLLTTMPAQPILYTEATVRANIDPSGLPTTYRVEYGNQGPCDVNLCSQTSVQSLAADAGPTDVQISLFGLSEGTTYHYRLLAANGADSPVGPDQTLTTLSRLPAQDCPNAALREQNNSTDLPDCRAYELVTPPDTRGFIPYAAGTGGGGINNHIFNDWLVTPKGPSAGNSLVFFLDSTLPGTDGNGVLDGLRATRGSSGWEPHLFSPSRAELQGGGLAQHGISSDHDYSLWEYADASYLRALSGPQLLGQGALGMDPRADGRYVAAGGDHVIFTSDQHLEPTAPAAGTIAVYDRSASGGPTHVVSLLPDSACGTPPCTPAAGQDASYQGSSEDGSAVLFELGGSLYERRDGATVKVTDGPNTYAGISTDASRVFYADANLSGDTPSPAGLFRFDADSQTTTQIAASSRFVNVSDDGTRVYFNSADRLDDASQGVPGANNLYLWDGSTITLVAVLAAQDLDQFFGVQAVDLVSWTRAVGPVATARGDSPTRSTSNGTVFAFQSHANLTSNDGGGFAQIYRYDASDQSLLCVSCPPTGDPASADAILQDPTAGSPAAETTLIPNLTSDGQRIFFESEDPLLPEDTNTARDVYEWIADGTAGCTRTAGCLALISSGRVNYNSSLYSVTPDGHDVFFSTFERLLPGDEASSSSIYDARVGGGFPPGSSNQPCVEDACQGSASQPPSSPGSGSSGFSGPGNQGTNRTPSAGSLKAKKCKKGKKRRKCHRVRRHHGATRRGSPG